MIQEVYTIDSTKKTPSIVFDRNLGELNISGKSLPEYSYGFYSKILDEVDDYIAYANDLTIINFKLEYINTLSSKIILQLILKFEKLLKIGKNVKIHWYYNDDDDMMFEIGQIYQSSTQIPVRLIETID